MARKANRLLSILAAGVLAVAAWAGSPREAHAGELRIVDQRGLVRAVKMVKKECVINARFIPQRGQAPQAALVNQEGIFADVPGDFASESSVVFKGVGEGTWQIRSNGILKDIQIDDAR